MATQKADLTYGLMSEAVVIDLLQKHFGTSFTHNGGYATFDFTSINGDIEVELKSRRICHDQYDTAIIGFNKVLYCKNPAKKYYFAFLYTDGLYIVQHKADLFNTFTRNQTYYRGGRLDCSNSPQHIVNIPVQHLQKVV
jgi:hypothetical protein